jgi:magnesium-transporting ATPase (P-type)
VTALCVLGKEPPLNAVMMLWVNLIMDTMGALALVRLENILLVVWTDAEYPQGTEPPAATLLQRRPYKRNASLINFKMMRNITVQFLFQMSMLGYLLFLVSCSPISVTRAFKLLTHLGYAAIFRELRTSTALKARELTSPSFSIPLYCAKCSTKSMPVLLETS